MTNYERILAFHSRIRRFHQDACFSQMCDKNSIGYGMFCLGFCTAAAAEAKDLDQRLR
jgi:hypothetical protein